MERQPRTKDASTSKHEHRPKSKPVPQDQHVRKDITSTKPKPAPNSIATAARMPPNPRRPSNPRSNPLSTTMPSDRRIKAPVRPTATRRPSLWKDMESSVYDTAAMVRSAIFSPVEMPKEKETREMEEANKKIDELDVSFAPTLQRVERSTERITKHHEEEKKS